MAHASRSLHSQGTADHEVNDALQARVGSSNTNESHPWFTLWSGEERAFLEFRIRSCSKKLGPALATLSIALMIELIRLGPSLNYQVPLALCCCGVILVSVSVMVEFYFSKQTSMPPVAAPNTTTAIDRLKQTSIPHSPFLHEMSLCVGVVGFTCLALFAIAAEVSCPWVSQFEVGSNGTDYQTSSSSSAELTNDKVVADLLNAEVRRVYCHTSIAGDSIVLLSFLITSMLLPVRLFLTVLLFTIQYASVALIIWLYVVPSEEHASNVTAQLWQLMNMTNPGTYTSGTLRRSALARCIMYLTLGLGCNLGSVVKDRLMRHQFGHSQRLEVLRRKLEAVNEKLCRQITATLPKHVIDRLLVHQEVQDYVPDAGIACFGIPSFSLWSSHHSSSEVVETLNRVFCAVDECLPNHPAVTKMQTLGDLYLAISGISPEGIIERNSLRSSKRIYRFSRDALLQLRNKCSHVTVSAAVHLGPVVATVLGNTATYVVTGQSVRTCINTLRSESLTSGTSPSSSIFTTAAFRKCLEDEQGNATRNSSANNNTNGTVNADGNGNRIADADEQRSAHVEVTPMTAQLTPSHVETSCDRERQADEWVRLKSVLSTDADGVLNAPSNMAGGTISNPTTRRRSCSPPVTVTSPRETAKVLSSKNGANDGKVTWWWSTNVYPTDKEIVFKRYVLTLANDPHRKVSVSLNELLTFSSYIIVAVAAGDTTGEATSVAPVYTLLGAAAILSLLLTIVNPTTPRERSERHFAASTSIVTGSFALDSSQLNHSNNEAVRSPIPITWYIVLILFGAARIISPTSWTSVAGVATWIMALLMRSVIGLTVRSPHHMVVVDVITVCVPLTIIQLVQYNSVLRSLPTTLFAGTAVEPLAIRSSRTSVQISESIQTCWVTCILLPLFSWIIRLARDDTLRFFFQQHAALEQQAIQLRDRQLVLEDHIRGVIPLHMQERFEEYSKMHQRPVSDVGQVDPWSGAWFATNVQQMPLLVMQLMTTNNDVTLPNDLAQDDQGFSSASSGMLRRQLLRLVDAHRKVDSVLRMMTAVCKAKSAGDTMIIIGSEKDDAIGAVRLLECAAAISRSFEGEADAPKIVLNSGLAVGAVIGSDSLTFELFGEVVSTSLELLNAMPTSGIIATQRFVLMYRQIQFSDAALETAEPSLQHHKPALEVHQELPLISPRPRSDFVHSESCDHPHLSFAPVDEGSHPKGVEPRGIAGVELSERMDTFARSDFDSSIMDLALRLYVSQTTQNSLSLRLDELFHTIGGSTSVVQPRRPLSGVTHEDEGQRTSQLTPSFESRSRKNVPSSDVLRAAESASAHIDALVWSDAGNDQTIDVHPPDNGRTVSSVIPWPVAGTRPFHLEVDLNPVALPFGTVGYQGLATVRPLDATGGVDKEQQLVHRTKPVSCDYLSHEVDIGGFQHWRVRGCGTVAVHTVHLRMF